MKRLLPLCLAALASTAIAQTYVNGPFVTSPSAYACGLPVPSGDGSVLETLAPAGLTTLGTTASNAIRLADDFVVPFGEVWTLNTIKVYAYQTIAGNATTSGLTAGNYRIWCGTPGLGGTNVADFSAASQWILSTWTGAYRTTDADMVAGTQCAAANVQRKIMDVIMSGNSIALPAGTYWLDFAITGNTALGGPFVPPISIPGTRRTGNGRQLTVATNIWVDATSGVSPIEQGFPFEINYTAASSAAPNPFQPNTVEASVDWNGVQAVACGSAAISTVCVGTNTTLNFSSSLGAAPWELAYSFMPAVSLTGGGFATTNGQTVNLNLLDPALGFLNNQTFPAFGTPLGGNPGSFSFPAPPLGTLTVQALVIGGSHPDGFRLSQAAQLNTVNATTLAFPIAGPATDESGVVIPLNTVPGCFGLGIPFYGTVRTQLIVYSNGYVSFDNFGVLDLSPTVLEASARTTLGCWENLNPGLVGSGGITITSPAAGQISVNYNGVWRFTSGSATNNVTYSILMDTAGNLSLQGLNGILPTPANSVQFLGISPGGYPPVGVSTPFVAGPFAVPAGSMSYRFTTGAPITTPAVSTINLTPDGVGGYMGNAF